MPTASESEGVLNLGATFRRLVGNRQYMWGVVAQFIYVGAQIAVWSFIIRYVMQEITLDEDQASSYCLAGLVLFTISRFACTGADEVSEAG